MPTKTAIRTAIAGLLAFAAAWPVRAQDALHPADQGQGFESPGPVGARRFLPAALFDAKPYRVSAEAFNDGLLNTYSLRQGREAIPVIGTTALLERWQEMRAIGRLRRITGTQAFQRALKQSAQETGASAKRLFTDPVNSLQRVPEGAKRFFGRLGDTLRGEEGDESRSGGALSGVLGMSEAKRKLAAQLGVDIYSANEALQAELDRVARAQALGASEEAITEFFEHGWYTPRDETAIIAALTAVGVNPEPFLRAACQARTRADALFYRNGALLAAAYGQRVAPLREFRVVEGVLCLLDERGALVLPVSFDYLQWTEAVARAAEAFADPARRKPDVKSVVLWTDGQVSARAQAELSQRSVRVEGSVRPAGK